MAEKQFSEWLKYQKWYKKQEEKGFKMSDDAYIWQDSYDAYLRQYDYMKKLKSENAQDYKDKSFYTMIRDRSYQNTSAQTSYFYNRITDILDDLGGKAAEGDHSATEIYNDFITKFGDIRSVSKQDLIYKGLKEGSMEFVYYDSKHYGWHGSLMDMMLYFENNGVIDQIYV